MTKIKQLVVAEEGQGLVEYALIIGLVSVALVTVLGSMSKAIDGKFKEIIGALGKK
jgi:pilus assembly protein Flp/PilA